MGFLRPEEAGYIDEFRLFLVTNLFIVVPTVSLRLSGSPEIPTAGREISAATPPWTPFSSSPSFSGQSKLGFEKKVLLQII